jgi:predicted amino acid racemase
MREDSVTLTAEIVELTEKDSAPKNTSAKNWAGEIIKTEDKGRRMRAILAIGEQDIAHPAYLLPMEDGIEVVGGSSDHTILDVTDAKRPLSTGDTVSFRLKYAAMLYAFTGDHVEIEYLHD